MEIVKRKPRIHHLRNKCCDIIDDGHKLIISDTGYGWGKGGKKRGSNSALKLISSRTEMDSVAVRHFIITAGRP